MLKLRVTSSRDNFKCERARRLVTWKERSNPANSRAPQIGFFITPPLRTTNRLLRLPFQQSFKTTSNNCAITTPDVQGNFNNPRRRHQYSSSSRASQGEWRAADPCNTGDSTFYLLKFATMTGALKYTPLNSNTRNLSGNTNVYVRTLFTPQQPPVFNCCGQPLPYQHTRCSQFQNPRDLRTPSEPPLFDLGGHLSVDGTFAQPLPITDDQFFKNLIVLHTFPAMLRLLKAKHHNCFRRIGLTCAYQRHANRRWIVVLDNGVFDIGSATSEPFSRTIHEPLFEYCRHRRTPARAGQRRRSCRRLRRRGETFARRRQ